MGIGADPTTATYTSTHAVGFYTANILMDVNGTAGQPNVRMGSLTGVTGAPFQAATDGIVVVDNNGVLRRSVFDVEQGLTFGDEGGQTALRLGSATAGNGAGTSPLETTRYVNLDDKSLIVNRGAGSDPMIAANGATDDVTINTATTTVLGSTSVGINTSGGGSTTIGSNAAGAISVTAAANVSLEAVGSGDITLTATGDAVTTNAQDISLQGSATVDMDAPAITINDVGTGTTQLGSSTAGAIAIASNSTVSIAATTSVNINDVPALASNTNIGTNGNTGVVTLGNASNNVFVAAPATFQRSINVSFLSISATTTLTAVHHVVVCTNAGLINVNLPPAATAGAGRVYVIKAAGTGDVVIDPDGAETIDGASTYTITGSGNLTRTVVSSGSAWYVIGN